MSKKNSGGSVYPHGIIKTPIYDKEHGYGGSMTQASTGMSLRDYFAGQAMNALIVSEKSTLDKILNMIDFHKDDFDDKVEKKRIQYMKMWIEQSFEIADAMVKESEQ